MPGVGLTGNARGGITAGHIEAGRLALRVHRWMIWVQRSTRQTRPSAVRNRRSARLREEGDGQVVTFGVGLDSGGRELADRRSRAGRGGRGPRGTVFASAYPPRRLLELPVLAWVASPQKSHKSGPAVRSPTRNPRIRRHFPAHVGTSAKMIPHIENPLSAGSAALTPLTAPGGRASTDLLKSGSSWWTVADAH